MAFDDLLRSGVALADQLTGSLQVPVQHESFTGVQNEFGKPTWAAAVERKAIVELRTRHLQMPTGATVPTFAKITFPRPVTIHPRDRITLPDGSTGPLVDVQGLFDAGNPGATYLSEVWLGASVGKGVV